MGDRHKHMATSLFYRHDRHFFCLSVHLSTQTKTLFPSRSLSDRNKGLNNEDVCCMYCT